MYTINLQHLSPAPPKWLLEIGKDDHRMINGERLELCMCNCQRPQSPEGRAQCKIGLHASCNIRFV